MKRTFLLAAFFCFVFNSRAQLSGSIHVPSTYSTLAAAINAVNSQGTAGPFTVSIAAGYTETAVAGGYSLYAGGSPTAPLVFQKSGNGPNPVLYAYTGNRTPGAAIQDGVWRLIGCDYVTIDGIDITDLNVSNPATMEFGFGLFKSGGADGCKYNTIKNCVITLSRLNNASGTAPAGDGSRGIEVVNALPAAHNSPVAVMSQAGSSSFNRFYGNTISNCNIGISLHGSADVSPFLFADTGNEIGGNSGNEANHILNFGGSGNNASAGIRSQLQYDLKINHNLINNNNGAGRNHTVTLRGVHLNNAPGANVTVSNNTLSLHGGAGSSQLIAIENAAGSAGTNNTVSVTGNLITGCSYSTAISGSFYGIWNSASAANLDISGNRFENNSSHTQTGSTYLIYNSGAVVSGLNLSGNSLGFKFTGSTACSGVMYGFYNTGGIGSASLSVLNNTISGIHHLFATGTGNMYMISNTADVAMVKLSGNLCADLQLNHSGTEYYLHNASSTYSVLSVADNTVTACVQTAPAGNMYCYYGTGNSPGSCVQTYSGNVFSNISAGVPGTGNFYGIHSIDGNNQPFPKKIINDNLITAISFSGSGSVYGIYCTKAGDDGNTGSSVSGNTISAVSSGNVIYGLYAAGPASTIVPLSVRANHFRNLSSGGAASGAFGVYIGGTNTLVDFYGNSISDITAGGTTGMAYGLYRTSTGFSKIYNNLIGDIFSPAATGSGRVNGIYLNSGSMAEISYNTIHLRGSSSGTDFGSNGIYLSSTATVSLRNNIIINKVTPTGSGISAAMRRSSSGNTNYLLVSDNNLFYAGTPGPGHVIFHNGTAYSSLSAFKSYIAPREAASVSHDQDFLNLNGVSPNFLHVVPNITTPAESAGLQMTAITADYDAEIRQGSPGYAGSGTAPDIGADEFELDVSPCSGATSGSVLPVDMVCAGESVVLIAKGYTPGTGLVQQWKVASTPGGPYVNATGGTGNNSAEYNTPALTAGIYYYVFEITCTNVPVTAISAEATVVVNAIPTASAMVASTTVCTGQSLILQGSSDTGTSYKWTGPAGFSSASQHPSVTISGTLDAGIYQLVTRQNGCASPVATLQIEVSEIDFEITVLKPLLCSGESATLSANNPGLNYLWSTGASGNSISVSPSITTVYSVVATGTANCQASAILTVTVTDPFISGSGAVSCMQGSPTILSVNAFTPSAVSWFANATASTAIASGPVFSLTAPALSTSYFAEATYSREDSLYTAAGGTVAMQGGMFDLFPLNSIFLNGFDLLFSSAGTSSIEVWYRTGSSAGFTSTVNGWLSVINATLNVPGPGTPLHLPFLQALSLPAGQLHGFYIVSVSGPSLMNAGGSIPGGVAAGNPDLQILQGHAGNSYFNLNNPGLTPDVGIRYTQKGCKSARIPVTLTVSATPTLVISASADTVCAGNTVTLTASGASAYTWHPGGNKNVMTVKPATASVYSVTGTDLYGCSATGSIALATYSLPLISITKTESVVCPSAAVTFTASGAMSYTWSTGATGNILKTAPAGISVYTVTGTDANGCFSSGSVAVSTRTVPVISITLSSGSICPGGLVSFTATGADSYTWYPGSEAGQTFTANPAVTSVFNAVGRSVNTCTNIAMAVVEVAPCLGTGELRVGSFSVYPNPVRDRLHMTFSSAGDRKIKVYDAAGVAVMSLETSEMVLSTRLPGLRPGIYFLVVNGRNETLSGKFILEKP